MKKFINKINDFYLESLRGFAAAHSELVSLHLDPIFITRGTNLKSGKVTLISGGGSGHEPLHAGFVGYGMLDAACPGHIFTSPTPDQILGAAESMNSPAGILFIVKNYSGDVMNFEMAAELFEGKLKSVIVADDVAVENSSHTVGRRGMAGTLVVEKIVGAAAEAGADLNKCHALAEQVISRTRSIGLALTSCTVPAVGHPTFSIGDREMEMGVGIHGEPGRSRLPLASANVIAADMVGAILDDMKVPPRSRILVLINGFGGTPMLELTLMYDSVLQALAPLALDVTRRLIGNYVTSLDMAGCSLTITVLDDEMLHYWDAPVHTPALRWGR